MNSKNIINVKRLALSVLAGLALTPALFAQHNYEFNNQGALVTVQAGAEVYVWGDVWMEDATAMWQHDGFMEVQGHMYSDNLFQQRGTGSVLMINNDVNAGQTQFIEGSYAVRSTGTGNLGVNDGSFYDLQLANDQGIVWLNGTGNVADVRNSLDFSGPGAPVVNRIITANPTALPANGSLYPATFGLMNSTAGLGNLVDNTITTNGNMSGVDNGYIQGKFRRAIAPAGGTYGYVMGLEPAAVGGQRGVQYMTLIFAANTYDVIDGYFETASSNAFAPTPECTSYLIDYFGGTDHGEWMYSSLAGGAGTYGVQVWPQDDNTFPVSTVWVVTKDNSLQGTANQCGPSPVALQRGGYSDFAGAPSEFDVASSSTILPVDMEEIYAIPVNNEFIHVDWTVDSQVELDKYEVERSTDQLNFAYIGEVDAVAGSGSLNYGYDDKDVEAGIEYFYRVRMVDLNGSFDYSDVVSATLDPSGINAELDIYPNPVGSDGLNIAITSGEDQILKLTIYDGLGKLVYNQTLEVPVGRSQYHIPTGDWAAGPYFLNLQGSKGSVIKDIFRTR